MNFAHVLHRVVIPAVVAILVGATACTPEQGADGTASSATSSPTSPSIADLWATSTATPTPPPDPREPTYAPGGRTGDTALDALIDVFVHGTVEDLVASFPDVKAIRWADPGIDGTIPADVWAAELVTAGRTLWGVARSSGSPGMVPYRDVDLVLAVGDPAQPAGWRIALAGSHIAQVLIGDAPPAHYLREPADAYGAYLVLPPLETLPLPPAHHASAPPTGNDTLDELLAIVEARDGTRLADLLETRTWDCGAPGGLACPGTTPSPGTAEAVWSGGCHSMATPQLRTTGEATLWLAGSLERLVGVHAVAVVPEGAIAPGAGHLVILIVQQSAANPLRWEARGLYEQDGRIIGIVDECGEWPATMYPPLQVIAPAVDPVPDGRRSGLDVIDRFLDAVDAGDRDTLASLIDFDMVGCVTEQLGIAGPPPCEAGEAAGTPVETFLVSGCEGSYVRRADAERNVHGLIGTELRLFTVQDVGPLPPGGWQRGRYQIVLSRGGSSGGLTGWFSERGLTYLWYGCGQTQALGMLRPGVTPAFVLPPPS